MFGCRRLTTNPSIRTIALFAHDDHGKTTEVGALFRQSGVIQIHYEIPERLRDRRDLERERGIALAAINWAIVWKSVKSNIIDTPGRADFSGEVERTLSRVD